ncbi:MAG: DNA double-strand break repair nuclease NurA [Thermoprotei archaeon]|nr:DNA double-strand break repair nuclease NurA [Thermoprotei archaeon]
MSHLEREGEISYTNPSLIVKVREKLIEFLSSIPDFSTEAYNVVLGSTTLGEVDSSPTWIPRRVAVVDGGSNIVSLNAGYLGIVTSLGLVIEGNRVIERVIAEPEIIPPTPQELGEYEVSDQIASVTDKVREAKVFETATELLSRNPDLLIIDGPLIPYGALGKLIVGSETELKALQRYRRAVLTLHKASLGSKVSVVGFVKRPRSRYLRRILNIKSSFDHITLSSILKEKEFYPNPPSEVPAVTEWFHEINILKLIREVKPKFTFLRLTMSMPPFRVDFGHLTRNYMDILNYLYSTRTREGIPYVIMKADEEVKITRKLLRELYEDALHSCIVKYFEKGFHTLIPVLPEYGGV